MIRKNRQTCWVGDISQYSLDVSSPLVVWVKLYFTLSVRASEISEALNEPREKRNSLTSRSKAIRPFYKGGYRGLENAKLVSLRKVNSFCEKNFVSGEKRSDFWSDGPHVGLDTNSVNAVLISAGKGEKQRGWCLAHSLNPTRKYAANGKKWYSRPSDQIMSSLSPSQCYGHVRDWICWFDPLAGVVRSRFSIHDLAKG